MKINRVSNCIDIRSLKSCKMRIGDIENVYNTTTTSGEKPIESHWHLLFFIFPALVIILSCWCLFCCDNDTRRRRRLEA